MKLSKDVELIEYPPKIEKANMVTHAVAAVFALAAAVLSGCGIARVKDLDVSSVGLKYIVPTSSRSVDAVLLLGIDNPSSLPLKLHNLEGTVRMGSKVLGYVTAGEVEIQKRSDMVYEIPCTATLADGVSILEVVSNKQLLMQIPEINPRFRAGLQNFAAMIMSFSESANNLPVDKLINTVLDESGYIKMLRESVEEAKRDNASREENLGAFVDSAKEFGEMNPNGTLEDFLNHVALITDLDNIDEEDDARVKLMTVHAAKGLEFPIVFIVGMEDGIFPHFSSFVDQAELEEERRACYVAITRAKKKLYITSAESRMFFGKKIGRAHV